MIAGAAAVGGAESAPAARPAPDFITKAPDQAAGRRALEDFRRAGIAGDYWLTFQLRVLPRKGAERTLIGRIFGARHGEAVRTRLLVGTDQWLIQSGADAAAWRWKDGAENNPTTAAIFEPIEGTDLTVFDLQMPFLHWNDFVYEGLDRVRGRPAHRVLLYPPAETAKERPELGAVRVYIDTQFQAMLQAELIDAGGKLHRTITVLDLKKTGDQWIVKSIDVRNHLTRDKTRFTVLAAALDLELPGGFFEPLPAMPEVPVIPEARIERF